jgi:hypothetical protein
MESFIQHIQDRIECLDDLFPCRRVKETVMIDSAFGTWLLRLFLLYLDLKMNSIPFVAFMIMDGGYVNGT